MLSPRTQLAVLAYSAIFPEKALITPRSPIPNYSVIEQRSTIARCLKFIELDVETWTVPRMRRSSNIFDIIVIWTMVRDLVRKKAYMCVLEIDLEAVQAAREVAPAEYLEDDPLFVSDRYVYIPWLPFNRKLSVWLGGPPHIVNDGLLMKSWDVYEIPQGISVKAASRPGLGRVPKALLR